MPFLPEASGGETCRTFPVKRADGDGKFAVMQVFEMAIPREMNALGYRRVELAGDGSEEGPRRGIALGDGAFDMLDLAAGLPGQNIGNELPSQPLSLPRNAHAYLPDKQGGLLVRGDVAGHPAKDLVVAFSDGAGGCEMAALQQIAVERVVVQPWCLADHLPHAHAVAFVWLANGSRTASRLDRERSAARLTGPYFIQQTYHQNFLMPELSLLDNVISLG